ncbi:MAG: minor capsid protein [Candidatus Hydrogenedentes bacterium]|nr:minor capsid protein [Candidatus Hydrogenedentota bacterium]
MQHNLREFLRHGGSGQYVFARQNGAVYGYRADISIKLLFPGYAELRADFTDQLDRVIADNARMLLNALTPPDTVPWVTEADLRDVSDAKEEALRQWDARLTAIFEEYETHPQRLRPLRTAMEERLLRAFAGLINQLRQQDLGIERYIWRSQDDAKVRDSHAEYDDQVFRWDEPPAGGHPGQAHNCRCVAEPVAPREAMITPVEYVPNVGGLPDVLPSPSELGSGLRALTRGGLAAVAAVGLEAFRRYAEEAAVQRSAERLGLDLFTVEGVLAARAHAWGQFNSGRFSGADWSGPSSEIVAEALSLHELSDPGALGRALAGNQEDIARIQGVVDQALRAWNEGRLTVRPGEFASGWVEVFPELTEGERRLGELPGFTPERIEPWLETYPAEALGLPNHTGSPAAEDPTGNIISTPVPDEVGPNIVEARRDEAFTTPGGNTIGDHGGKGDGLEYITGKGHTVGQIDDIIANPRPDLSGIVAGRGRYRGQDMTLLTGQDGHWVLLSPEGRVVAVSNRNRPLWETENEPDPIIRPLE